MLGFGFELHFELLKNYSWHFHQGALSGDWRTIWDPRIPTMLAMCKANTLYSVLSLWLPMILFESFCTLSSVKNFFFVEIFSLAIIKSNFAMMSVVSCFSCFVYVISVNYNSQIGNICHFFKQLFFPPPKNFN